MGRAWRRADAWGVVVALLLLVAPAAAQSLGERVYRLAVLSPVRVDRSVLIPELARLGFAEGRNLVVDERIGDAGAMPGLVQDAVAARPDAIIVIGQAALFAAQASTAEIPIVTFGNDPFRMGAAATLARPGGNVTGVVFGLTWELDGKRLELLHQILPGARRIGALMRRSSDGRPELEQEREAALRAAAARIAVELQIFTVDGSGDYERTFASMRAAGIEALALAANIDFVRDAAVLAEHAIAARLPMACESPAMASQGCLLGYGPSLNAIRRRVAALVARIFRGATPSELPIETPAIFELAVNLRTAQALGLAIPQGLLVRTDEVIE